MNTKKFGVALIAVIVLAVVALAGCSKTEPVAVAEAPAMTAPVSDGSEDLKIDYRLNVAAPDPENFFSFSGNIRYMAVDMDQPDENTGASAQGSTQVFHAYLYDVEGKTTLSAGLRGLFLFAVNPFEVAEGDALDASKASDGTITVQFVHRGSAYRIITDENGQLTFPDGQYQRRNIGYIQGGGPQVLSTDFSADGTSATIDWDKVWDSGIAGGKIVTEGVDRKTGDIVPYGAQPDSLYYFDGTLDAALESDILTINGALTAVPRR